jgi:small GTP-binding protein
MEWASGDAGVPRDSRPSVKIILVGSSGVGKTCLSASYLKQNFEKNMAPTVAPAYSCRAVKRADGLVVVLQIWDTAGQERYASISQLFFRDSDVAFVCFDPNDRPSLTSAREWVERVLTEVPKCRLYAVLTKADKVENVDAVLSECRQLFGGVNFEQFFVTSSFTRQGIDAPFAAAAEAYTPIGVELRRHLRPNEKGSGCC